MTGSLSFGARRIRSRPNAGGEPARMKGTLAANMLVGHGWVELAAPRGTGPRPAGLVRLRREGQHRRRAGGDPAQRSSRLGGLLPRVRRPFVRDPPQPGGRLTHYSRGRVSSGKHLRFGRGRLPRGGEQARPAGVRREASSGGGAASTPAASPVAASAVAVPRARTVGWSTRLRTVYASPDLLGAPRVIAIVVSAKVRSASTPGARPRT
jgi:hypothetical protein